MVKFVTIFSILLSTLSVYAKTEALSTPVFQAYIKIQEALSNDSLTGVSAAAKEIIKNSKDKNLITAATELSKASSLEAARIPFEGLSTTIELAVKKEPQKGYTRVICPMKKASWVQKKGEIKNPYYGKEMQSCGEIQN